MYDDVKYNLFINDLLDLVANTNLPVATSMGFMRTHILNSDFPLRFTDEYIAGWLGAESVRIAVKYTGLDPDEVLDRVALELSELDVMRKLKQINPNELSCKIVAYLYLYAKLSGHQFIWNRTIAIVEEATDVAA